MRLAFVFYVLLALLSYSGVSAQVVSQDSLKVLNDQKKVLALNKRLNDSEIELAKLENQIPGAVDEATSTAERAQRSAEENKVAAGDLSSDPQDKQLARKASKAASAAIRDAKRARKAADNLAKLRRNVDSLREKIKEDEDKLALLTPN
ncbi:hypothetical protein SAMN05216327_12312 [Dyadobacter sp. SG02]|uniref:hypothetical protein n=1 Tax=Dyadobacter sp. SG02 TaxID=1855291 RepID=UPI0008D2ED07|nr:hypothetical protein [Dyadobacter sp. SG02]SEJ83592.1 hypothetical protein SAMN05216327_12312 [Dyadobacter sp. SG02]